MQRSCDARQRTECDQPNRRVEIKLFGQAPDAR